MSFNIPTTKQEMYEILQEIYKYYRIDREIYSPIDLKELDLKELTYKELTEEELKERAKEILKSEQQEKVLKRKESLKEQIDTLTKKKSQLKSDLVAELEKIDSEYTASEEKVKIEATKKGFAHSNIVLDKLAELEKAKNNSKQKTQREYDESISQIESEIATLKELLENADSYYSDIFDSEITAKVIGLKETQQEKIEEIFKYNNGIQEKLQKYANSIKEKNMSFKLKYMDISTSTFTKEQLVEMGYYDDIIKCVCGYYDMLSPKEAYADIITESKIAFYLEDFYQNIIYMYKSRAGE